MVIRFFLVTTHGEVEPKPSGTRPIQSNKKVIGLEKRRWEKQHCVYRQTTMQGNFVVVFVSTIINVLSIHISVYCYTLWWCSLFWCIEKDYVIVPPQQEQQQQLWVFCQKQILTIAFPGEGPFGLYSKAAYIIYLSKQQHSSQSSLSRLP